MEICILLVPGAQTYPYRIRPKFGAEIIQKRGLRKGGLTGIAQITSKFILTPIDRLKIEAC